MSLASILTSEAITPLLWTSRRPKHPSAWHGHVAFAHWLIWATKPRTVVELGTHNGVSYLAFCHAVAALGLPTTCYAVDTWRGDEHAGSYDETVYDSINEFNSTHYSAFSTLLRCTFDDALNKFEAGTVDLLHIDGCHSYEAVSHDYLSWKPKLSSSGVILFHDTEAYLPGFGVWKLWADLRHQYPSISFRHSSGLGVLLVGEKVSPALQELAEANERDVTIIQENFSLFSDLARR